MSLLHINGKIAAAHLYDSISRKNEYSWKQGSGTPFKTWYAKKCPKVNHDYTVHDLLQNITAYMEYTPILAVLWIALNVYIYYYMGEEDEDMAAVIAVIGSLLLHVFLYSDFRFFSYAFGRVRLIPIALLLLSPIIAPLAIIALNWTDVPDKESYKEYLWWWYTGTAALYAIIGCMGSYRIFFII